ncbi:hypothetical protein UA08_03206 [Talaromyces atroroseus]|uniref:Uncharacterized protein n=1 Tax=Talaromyces atroroseus TaxID=1441469 RepID=A0A225AIY8_TALAT|nr:hypothetical protein UA08_03206 [Talaromyces atroroseus]OKL60850.1 hypothetical protein UA08_03206 [Talaromyces atroroseus]
MDITQGAQLEFTPPPLKHRGDGIAFKDLFRGEDGAPENYYFSVARQAYFYSPRHRHNFDQFRYALRNTVSICPDMVLAQGELAYHPEGVHYGPQHDDDGLDRDVLVLQFGGTSGQGYLSFQQLAQAQEPLKEKGRFEGGKYYANGSDANGVDGKDGYEAIWEHHHGRPLVYPPPRFDKPILVKPENFGWKPYPGLGEGVFYKNLGIFTERETRVQMVRTDSGSTWRLDAQNSIQLLYVVRGQGSAMVVRSEKGSFSQAIQVESAIRLKPESESILLSATSEMEILHFVLPMLS